MKKIILATLFLAIAGITASAQSKDETSKVTHLTYKEFLSKVWDFEKSPNNFEFKGKVPAVIDFYADWCGPCRKVSPIMEKLAQEYKGRLSVYKINVDQERDLASVFNIRSIPAVLFVPLNSQPMIQVGAMSEADYKKVIEERLLK